MKHKYKSGTKLKCVATMSNLKEVGIVSRAEEYFNKEVIVFPFQIPFNGKPSYALNETNGQIIPENLLAPIQKG